LITLEADITPYVCHCQIEAQDSFSLEHIRGCISNRRIRFKHTQLTFK